MSKFASYFIYLLTHIKRPNVMQKYSFLSIFFFVFVTSIFAQQSKITVKGSVEFPDDRFNIHIFYRDHAEKIVVDSLMLNDDNTFEKVVTLPAPGKYTINCQNWEMVNFWGENEDIEINFRGQDTARIKIKNPPYRHIESSGKNNELMNWVNYLDFQTYQAMIEAGREIHAASVSSCEDWKNYAEEGYDKVYNVSDANIDYLGTYFGHLNSAITLIPRLKDQKVKKNLIAYFEKNKPDYPPFIKYKNEIAANTESLEKLVDGAVAPSFTYFMTDGSQKENIKQFEGKYLLVEFWASWCGPCRKSIPKLKELYSKYESKGFEILSVSIDEKKESWLKALTEENMTWMQAHTSNSGKEVMGTYQFSGIPFLVLIDRDGKIVKRGIGMDKLEEFLEEISM